MRLNLILPLVVLPALVAGLVALEQGRGWSSALWSIATVAVAIGVVAHATLLRPTKLRLDELTRKLETVNRRLEQGQAQIQEAARLSAVFDAMVEGIWITDAQGTILRHNPALAGLLGQEGSLAGRRPLDLLRKAELHDAVMLACGPGTTSQLEITLESAVPRTLGVRATALGGELRGSAAVFRDITELRRLEKVRQDFVANVSHELRTPITAILGYAETLRAGALDDSRHAPQMVEIIHRQSERLSQLVSELLDLAKLDARQMRLVEEPVPLQLTVSRAAEVVQPMATRKGVAMTIEVPRGLQALGDAYAIEQVLINLLDNAVHHTPSGGKVKVTGAEQGGALVLRVTDTGIGIDAKSLPRLFERFYRVDSGRSRGGTGLGLAIVKHLLAAMHGDVEVESTVGQGSTFTVLLPGVSASSETSTE